MVLVFWVFGGLCLSFEVLLALAFHVLVAFLAVYAVVFIELFFIFCLFVVSSCSIAVLSFLLSCCCFISGTSSCSSCYSHVFWVCFGVIYLPSLHLGFRYFPPVWGHSSLKA